MLIIVLNVYDFIGSVQDTISSSVAQGFSYAGIALYILSFLYYAVPMPVWQRLTKRGAAVETVERVQCTQDVSTTSSDTITTT